MKAVVIKLLRPFGLDALLARALEKFLQALIKKTEGLKQLLCVILNRLQNMQNNPSPAV